MLLKFYFNCFAILLVLFSVNIAIADTTDQRWAKKNCYC